MKALIIVATFFVVSVCAAGEFTLNPSRVEASATDEKIATETEKFTQDEYEKSYGLRLDADDDGDGVSELTKTCNAKDNDCDSVEDEKTKAKQKTPRRRDDSPR